MRSQSGGSELVGSLYGYVYLACMQSRCIETKPQDYLVLTMTPPDLSKSPFKELRMVVPIRLATNRWNNDGTGFGAYGPPSISSSEELAATPELPCTS
jgi:hypothetical protein